MRRDTRIVANLSEIDHHLEQLIRSLPPLSPLIYSRLCTWIRSNLKHHVIHQLDCSRHSTLLPQNASDWMIDHVKQGGMLHYIEFTPSILALLKGAVLLLESVAARRCIDRFDPAPLIARSLSQLLVDQVDHMSHLHMSHKIPHPMISHLQNASTPSLYQDHAHSPARWGSYQSILTLDTLTLDGLAGPPVHTNHQGGSYGDAQAKTQAKTQEKTQTKIQTGTQSPPHGGLKGYQWIELLDAKAFAQEGLHMRHCLGSYALETHSHAPHRSSRIFSLRDASFKPHLTAEVSNRELIQVKGKGQSTIAARYTMALSLFIREGLKSPLGVRSCEDVWHSGYVWDDTLRDLIPFEALPAYYTFEGSLRLSHRGVAVLPPYCTITDTLTLEETFKGPLGSSRSINLLKFKRSLSELPILGLIRVVETLHFNALPRQATRGKLDVNFNTMLQSGQASLRAIPLLS